MVKKGNTRVIITLGPKNTAKLKYICEEVGLKKTAVLNMALDVYYDILRKDKA